MNYILYCSLFSAQHFGKLGVSLTPESMYTKGECELKKHTHTHTYINIYIYIYIYIYIFYFVYIYMYILFIYIYIYTCLIYMYYTHIHIKKSFADRLLYTMKKLSAHHRLHVSKCLSCISSWILSFDFDNNWESTLFTWLHMFYAHFASASFEHFVCRGYIYIMKESDERIKRILKYY